MPIKVRNANGEFVEIPALVGDPGVSAPAIWFSENKKLHHLCIGANCRDGKNIDRGLCGAMNTARVYSSALNASQISDRFLNVFAIEHKDCAAVIGDTEYETLEEALGNVKENDTVIIMAGTYDMQVIKSGVYKNVTIIGETGVVCGGLHFNLDVENVTIKNIVFVGSALGLYVAYNANGVTIQDCTFNGENHLIHLADVDRLGYSYSNVVIERCEFSMIGNFSSRTAIYTRNIHGLIVKDCNFNRANFNAIQSTSPVSGDIVIINNVFKEIGSRNVHLAGITDSFDGNIIIYGNSFAEPTVDPRDHGNFVYLGFGENMPNYIIGMNFGEKNPEKDGTSYYFNKCEESSEDYANHYDINNETESLIVDVGILENGTFFNTVDDAKMSTIGFPTAMSDGCIDFNGQSGLIFDNFGYHCSNVAHGITVEAYVKLSSFDNNPLIIGNIVDKRGASLVVDSSTHKPIFTVFIGGIGYISAEASVELIDNTFYHLAGTYDGKCVVIYVNGKEAAKTAVFYVPKRGTDYWTDEDKSEIVGEAAEAASKYSAPKAVLAKSSLDDSGCTELILPDGIDIKDGLLVSYYSLKTSANDPGGLKIGNITCAISRLFTKDPANSGGILGNQSLYNAGDTITVRLTYFPEYTIDGYTTPEHWEAVLVGVLSEYVFAEKVLGGSFSGVVSASPWTQTPDSSLIRNSSLLPSNGGIVVPSFNGEVNWYYG